MPENDNQRNDLLEQDFAAAMSPPDLKGRINLRVEQMLQQEIEDIAEDSKYPLRSVSEVVRFCCLLGIERLREWKPAPTLIGAIKAANALATRDQIQCDALDMLQKMDQRVEWYINKKEWDEAIAFIAQIRSYFEGIQDDFWKRHIINEIDERFQGWYRQIEDAKDKEEHGS